MVARSLDYPRTMLGGGFCRLTLVLWAMTITDQHRNLISRKCTRNMKLDESPWKGLTGFAGLATRDNLCMMPDKRYEIENFCSVADHPGMTHEPNVMLQWPKLDFPGLAEKSSNNGILQLEFRTGWMEETLCAAWTRDLPGCMDFVYGREDYFHYNSGNFDNAGIQEFSSEFSMVDATPNYFQYHSGNLHLCNFHSNAGNLNGYNFQCGFGYFNLAINSAALGTSATWPMQVATFP